MKKQAVIGYLLFLIVALLAAPLPAARGQAAAPTLTVLDQAGQPASRLTDGDTLRLRLELAGQAAAETPVSFRLAGLETEIAACAIPAGQVRCESQPFASLGWYWGADGQAQPERTVEAWQGGSLLSSATVAVASRPVVMVHGFSSNWQAWTTYLGPQGYLAGVGLRGYAVGDGQLPGALNTGNLADPTGRTNTIAENAAILGQYIQAVKQQTGAQKVDLLVHSLGGLISRYYIDRLMPEGEVAQLLILGTPMAGTGCANLPAALGFYLPAVLEFQPSYVQEIFNPQITHRRGVAFYALAGVPLVDPVQSPCTVVPSDVAVSAESVSAIEMETVEMPVLHTELNTSPEVFGQFVLPHLQRLPGSFTVQPDPAGPAAAFPPLQFTRLYTGHLAPGEMHDLTINIEANVTVASFALYDSSRSLEVQVTGASGKVLTLDPVANGLIRVDDPAALLYLGYGFNNPKPGAWQVKLLATGQTPAAGADYALTAVYQGGATLTARASAMTPPLNAPLLLSASLELGGQPLAISQAQATIRAAGRDPQTLSLGPAAGSSEVQATWQPAQPGLYGIEISASGLAADGLPVERTAFLTVEVQPPAEKAYAGLIVLLGGVVLLGALGLVGVLFLLRRRRG